MSINLDTVREALIKLRAFAKGLDCDYQEKCTPGEDDMCQSCKHVYIADEALAALSTIDPEAKIVVVQGGTCGCTSCPMYPKTPAHDDAIRREFWEELRDESEIHCDRRVELLGPIETTDDAAFRKTLLDGWSAWLLAKRIIDNRRAFILATDPAREVSE